MHARLSIAVATALSTTLLTGCGAAPPAESAAAPEAEVRLDFLHERIVRLDADEQGDTWVGFEWSVRQFVIPRAETALLAFAKSARESGKPVYATVRAGHGPKVPPAEQPPIDAARKQQIAVVRLSFEPDPRAAAAGR